MKTKLGLLALLALLLLSGCDAIFDTLIEAVYKDQIDENAFGEVEVPVTIWIGENWDGPDDRDHPLKLALVPYYEASGGIVPDWDGRIEQTLGWDNLNEEFGSTQGRFVAYFRVQKGYANWRLFVWQPRSGDYSTIVAGAYPAGDPSKTLNFSFQTAWGSSDVLNDDNLDSGPGVDDWFTPSDRAHDYILSQLFGGGAGEAMNLNGAQNIDATEATSGVLYYFSLSRYGSEVFKRVREIQVQRRSEDNSVIYRRSWEPEWIVMSVEDWNEYNSYFEFGLGFDSLLENGNPGLPVALDDQLVVNLEAKLVYEDGSELLASPQILPVTFYSSGGNQILAGTPFSVDCTVDLSGNSDYYSRLARFILYDENWNLLRVIDTTLGPSGEVSFGNFRDSPSYSSIEGGRYKFQIILDMNEDGDFGGYNDGPSFDYDHYAEKEIIVTTDGGSNYDPYYGWIYVGALVFTATGPWYEY